MTTTLATLLVIATWMQNRCLRAPCMPYETWHRRASARGLVVEWTSMSEAIARSLGGTIRGGFDNGRGRGWLD